MSELLYNWLNKEVKMIPKIEEKNLPQDLNFYSITF